MKIRDEQMIPIWAARPDAFELEPEHVQKKHRGAVKRLVAKMKRDEESAAKGKPAATKSIEEEGKDEAQTR